MNVCPSHTNLECYKLERQESKGDGGIETLLLLLPSSFEVLRCIATTGFQDFAACILSVDSYVDSVAVTLKATAFLSGHLALKSCVRDSFDIYGRRSLVVVPGIWIIVFGGLKKLLYECRVPDKDSPMCACGGEEETAEHIPCSNLRKDMCSRMTMDASSHGTH